VFLIKLYMFKNAIPIPWFKTKLGSEFLMVSQNPRGPGLIIYTDSSKSLEFSFYLNRVQLFTPTTSEFYFQVMLI
jgi:hypothetical protein